MTWLRNLIARFFAFISPQHSEYDETKKDDK